MFRTNVGETAGSEDGDGMRASFRSVDLDKLNSLTKYPSIPTYHALDPSNGSLRADEVGRFDGNVIVTEKIDGTNARVIVSPDGEYVIGSREELLYARGDLIWNPSLGIVGALRAAAESLTRAADSFDGLTVFYLEVYGGKTTAGAKQYTGRQQFGARLFDAALIGELDVRFAWSREQIAAWRDRGGQTFVDEQSLHDRSAIYRLALTPRIAMIDALTLPRDIPETYAWLKSLAPRSAATLDDAAGGTAEGVVIRTELRTSIAKLRFDDYARTLNPKNRKHMPSEAAIKEALA